ncbi:MAG: hypothetical protein J3K34DRAFT_457729 [Monoraphidium minutum]|nr:MAG: hypothetical protein J3K34DRAFT_457729 [Monoraphidium minutum]
MACQEQPKWAGKHGVKRLQLEFRDLARQAAEGKLAYEAELVGDDWRRWRIRLPPSAFDDDLAGGRDLRSDLARLARDTGAGYILLEARFPDVADNYPTEPFKLRVVYPRCAPYTGHVTIGGSICIEALTLSGGPGAWQPSYCVESIMQIVICNAIDCEVKTVQTPGGVQRVGPLRVDFSRRRGGLRDEYSEAEAEAAFSRMVAHHAAHGWGGGGGGGGGGSGGSGWRGRGRVVAAAAGPAAMPPKRQKTAGQPPPAAPASGAWTAPGAAAPQEEEAAAEGQARQQKGAPAADRLAELTLEDGGEWEGCPGIPLLPALDAAAAAGGASRAPRRAQRARPGRRGGGSSASSGASTHSSDEEGAHEAGSCGADASPGAGAAPPPPPLPAAAAGGGAGHTAGAALLESHGEVERLRQQLAAAAAAADAAHAAAAAAASAGSGARLRAALPAHWAAMGAAEADGFKLVALPLPQDLSGLGAAPPPDPLAAAEAALPPGRVDELVANGLTRRDAVAALSEAAGDVAGAIAFHLGALDQVIGLFLDQMAGVHHGGGRGHHSRRGSRAGGRSGGGGRVVVRRVERVQNWRLWTGYAFKREHVQDEVGGAAGALNEHRLWHGTPSRDNIYSIVAGGFKAQYSSLSASLGAGVYFGGHAAYSHKYASDRAVNAAAGLRRGRAARHFAPPAPGGGTRRAAGGSGGGGGAAAGVPQGHRWEGRYVLLLCRVVLGRIEAGRPHMRLPSPGFHSAARHASGAVRRGPRDAYAVFDNHQAYPEYLVQYDLI